MGLFLSTHQSAGLTESSTNRKVPAGAENARSSLSACQATKSGRWSGEILEEQGRGHRDPWALLLLICKPTRAP